DHPRRPRGPRPGYRDAAPPRLGIRAGPHLLEHPGVAVRVGEVGERVGLRGVRLDAVLPTLGCHVANRADLHALFDELVAHDLDVLDHEMRATVRAGLRLRDAD